MKKKLSYRRLNVLQHSPFSPNESYLPTRIVNNRLNKEHSHNVKFIMASLFFLQLILDY